MFLRNELRLDAVDQPRFEFCLVHLTTGFETAEAPSARLILSQKLLDQILSLLIQFGVECLVDLVGFGFEFPAVLLPEVQLLSFFILDVLDLLPM